MQKKINQNKSNKIRIALGKFFLPVSMASMVLWKIPTKKYSFVLVKLRKNKAIAALFRLVARFNRVGILKSRPGSSREALVSVSKLLLLFCLWAIFLWAYILWGYLLSPYTWYPCANTALIALTYAPHVCDYAHVRACITNKSFQILV